MPYQPFMGEIMYFAGNFAPRGWALCNGQTLQVNQNAALFALLGITYGGDGSSTFKLPDLRGRALMGSGTSASGGGTTTAIGTITGAEQVQLTAAQMPSHFHSVAVSSNAATTAVPSSGAALGATSGSDTDGNSFPVQLYSPSLTSATPVATGMVSQNGANQPHENRQPFAVLNACIALNGVYPPRP